MQTISGRTDDDYDGVDVTYINPSPGQKKRSVPDGLITLCRKVRSYSGHCNDADRAYRIGMRRLMKYLHQRRTYECTTSLLGWCYQFGDHIILSDDILTGKTISCLIEG
jgi:hypothetical protein